MVQPVRPPMSGTITFWGRWCKRHGGVLKIIHKNPRGVIEIVQGGMRHVYHNDKYGKKEGRYGKYSWGSSFPVDFLAKAVNDFHRANPDAWTKYMEPMRSDWPGAKR